MKNILLFIAVLLSLNLSSQTTDWVKSLRGYQHLTRVLVLVLTRLGFMYTLVGYFNGDADFGPFQSNRLLLWVSRQ